MKRLVAITLLVLFSFPSLNSVAIADLPSGVTMLYVLDEIEKKAQALIDESQNATNNVVNNAAYNIVNSVVQVRQEYEEALEKTSEELTRQQRVAFEGLYSRVNQIFNNIKNEHTRIDDTLDNLANYLSDTIFVSDEPRISRFLSNMAVSGSIVESDLLIQFRGKNLNHEKNKLSVDSGSKKLEIQSSERSDNSLSFTIPRSFIENHSNDTSLSLIPIQISLYEDYWIFFSEEKTYKYHVRVLPNRLASARIFVKQTKKAEIERREKQAGGPTGSFDSGRSSRRRRNISMNAYPDNGWKIDTRTVRRNLSLSNRCSSRETRCSDISSSPTQANLNCSIVTERGHGYRRVTCSYALSMSFQQYREEDKTEVSELAAKELQYDSPVTWNIPNGKTFDRIELTLFNDRKVIYEKEVSNQILSLSVDPDSKTVILGQNLEIDELN